MWVGTVSGKMRKLVVLLFMLLAFQQAALAEDSHNFFDRTNVLLHGVNITAQALEFYSTERVINRPGIGEANPLGQSRRGRIALKSMGVAAPMGLSYLLHRAGHHKAERFMPVILAVPTGVAAGLNFRF